MNKGGVAMAGDGQITFGEMAFKQKAVKVRELKIAADLCIYTNDSISVLEIK